LVKEIETDKLIGQTLEGKYRIESLVARGGMAKVYKSLQINLNRPVAVKVLDPKHVGADDPEFRKRFGLEAQMTSQLNHPNTVTIHDYGYNEQFDIYYFVMEFITGRTLRREMKQLGEFPVERALYIAEQIARSVRQAHSVGVVHRDLKPSNVLLTKHDEDKDWVKVVDFGLLKLRKESVEESTKGVLMGSPRYMSPEQIRRSELDHRSDIYSLGVNLYQMLAGKAPFEGQRAMEILMGHLNNPPPPLSSMTNRADVPAEVESLTMTLLAKKPEDRPQDMEDVIEAIGRLRKLLRTSVAPAAPKPKQAAEASLDIAVDVVEDIPPLPSIPIQWSDSVPSQELGKVPTHPTGPVPRPEVTGVGEAPSRRGLWVAIASIVVLVMGGAAIAVVVMTDTGSGKPRIQTAAVAGGETAVKQDARPEDSSQGGAAGDVDTAIAADVPHLVRVFFKTDPEGAEVLEGDTVVCTVTPCDTDWAVGGGQGNARTFKIVMEGYEDLELTEEVPDRDVEISVDLFPKDASGGKKPGKKVGVKVEGGEVKPPKGGSETGTETTPGKKKSLGLDEVFPE